MGILQAKILEWVVIPPPGDLPNPGIEPRSPAQQVDSVPSGPPGKSPIQVLFNASEGDIEVYIVPIACKLVSLGVYFLPVSTQPLPPSALR